MIGPFRGGRTVGAAGIADQPNVFYIGVNNGGVWKTDDYGRTWKPIFDDQPTGSIGAIAVAPSDPNIIYVGSGEGLQRPDLSVGDGIYKSTDGGKTWRHLGLRDGAADPGDPRRPARPESRLRRGRSGIRTGRTPSAASSARPTAAQSWQKVLYKDEHTGAVDLAFDPRNPQTVYAVLWQARQGPWENGAFSGPNSGLFKSTDGGTTWKQLTGGLPTFAQGLGRIGIGIAPSDPNRMYALVESRENGGLYRSDDAGASWRLVNREQRDLRPRQRFRVRARRSEQQGHRLRRQHLHVPLDRWRPDLHRDQGRARRRRLSHHLDQPAHPEIILLASDQGATITVNGGATWSSLVQPADRAVLSRDHRQPVPVLGLRRAAGERLGRASRAAATTARSRFATGIPSAPRSTRTSRPTRCIPNIIYGGTGVHHALQQAHRRRAGRSAPKGKYRYLRTAPLLFSEVDPHVLYLGAQKVLKTTDGGDDLDGDQPGPLARILRRAGERRVLRRRRAKEQATRRGVVYSLAPSRLNVNTIWAGTDDGLIHLTRDGGKSWKNVTPPGMTPWSKVAQLDASHFDDQTVYAAVNRLRLDDLKPHIYRTHDGGATWKETVRGLPDGPVNAVREDPVRKGLLFAGTETRRLRFVQRWRRLAAAAAEHARDVDPRPGRARRRSRGGHARARASGFSTTSRRCAR